MAKMSKNERIAQLEKEVADLKAMLGAAPKQEESIDPVERLFHAALGKVNAKPEQEKPKMHRHYKYDGLFGSMEFDDSMKNVKFIWDAYNN